MRRRYHGLAAAVLERTPAAARPEDRPDRLARHYRGAMPDADPAPAVAALLAAADRSAGLGAYLEASRNYVAALAIVRSGHDPERLPAILERLGECWEKIGERAAAVAVLTEALAMVRPGGDPRTISRLCRQLALAEFHRCNHQAGLDWVDTGLALLRGTPLRAETLDLHFIRFTILGCSGRLEEGLATAGAWQALAREIGTDDAMAKFHLGDVARHIVSGDAEQMNAAAHRALACAAAAGAHREAIDGHTALAHVAWEQGDHQTCLRHALDGINHALSTGHFALLHQPGKYAALAHWLAGTWSAGLTATAELISQSARYDALPWLAIDLRALLWVRLGNLDEAEACMREARAAMAAVTDHLHLEVDCWYTEALIAHERGNGRRTEDLLAKLTSWYMAPLPLALQAESSCAAGHPAGARAAADQLRGQAGPHSHYVRALALWANAWALRAEAAPPAAVAEAFGRAAEAFATLAMPFDAARAQFEQAVAQVTVAPASAIPLALGALTALEQLGAAGQGARVARWLKDQGHRVPARREAGEAFSPLEREIVQLVAAGMTNAAIASRLAISVRTVTTHLDRLYRRFGVANRTALARFAADRGAIRTDQDTMT